MAAGFGHALGGTSGQDDFEDAEEVQGKNKDDCSYDIIEPRVLELEGPGDFAAGRFERDDDGGESEEPKEDAGGEGETMLEDIGAGVSGLAHEAENLQRDDRQHAGHEVEDEAADQAEEEVGPEAGLGRGRCASCGGGVRFARNDPAAACPVFEHHDAAHRRGAGGRNGEVGGACDQIARCRVADRMFVVGVRKEIGPRRGTGVAQAEVPTGGCGGPRHGEGWLARGRKLCGEFGEEPGVGWFGRRGHREGQLQVGFARDADRFADQPCCFDRDADFRGVHGGRRGDRADEKDFAFVGVDLDVAGLDDALRERPSGGAGRKAGGKLRFEFGGEARVTGIFPVSVPAGSHAEKKAEPEGLPGDNRRGVGQKGGFDQFLTLVELGGGRKSEEEKRKKKSGKNPAAMAGA